VRVALAGAPNPCPADAALSLPARRCSHALARLAAVEATRGSFEAAHAAGDIAAFYTARVPVPCTASTLLVISAGTKGIVMRPAALRPAAAKAAARQGRMRTRLAAGGKPNRKRMATLACVYDAEPSPRRPHDIIAPPGGRHGHRALRPRPEARARWLAGSVEHDPAGMIAAAFSEAEARDPQHQRTWVVLVDGAEHQLDLIRAEAQRRSVTIHVVIDLIHVLEYIWKAAWCLHAAWDPAAGDWVAGKTPAVLAGDSDRAAAGITAEADAAGLAGAQRPAPSVCPLPDQQARVPALRPGPDRGLAHRHRGHRRSMPPPHRRPPRHHRSQMGTPRRRSHPHHARRHQQRRLRRLLALPPRPRAPAALPRHSTRPVHAQRLTLTPNEPHPIPIARA
jgi:hypothetical protein